MSRQKQGPSPRAIQVKELRDQGYSLQAIGEILGVTKQAVAQVLVWHFGTTRRSYLVARSKICHMLGIHEYPLRILEEQGLLTPLRMGAHALYDIRKLPDICRVVQENQRQHEPDTVLMCEECGTVFTKRPYDIRFSSPCRFCSDRCKGAWIGRTFGFQKGHSNYRQGKDTE